MSHIISAIENALSAGRWNDAAPLLSDILQDGIPARLQSLEHYEAAAGSPCTSDTVRKALAFRLGVLERARNRFDVYRLASIVRDHAMPCRIVAGGKRLRVASQAWNGERWLWTVEEITADRVSVSRFLGYGS
jgi:hypothetical protein